MLPGYGEIGLSRSIDRLITDESELETAENCFSVLVETGVFSRDAAAGGGFAAPSYSPLEHSPRDFLPAETSFQGTTSIGQNNPLRNALNFPLRFHVLENLKKLLLETCLRI